MNAVVERNGPDAGVIEQVVLGGDLARLTPQNRIAYYHQVCKSLNLNPLTKPFDYINLNGKLTLYARKDCTDQLRNRDGISISIVDRSIAEGICTVTAKATNSKGRSDESIGAVTIENLRGDARANAIMKCETKAKRRVTLSICGLGMLDESELETIHSALSVAVDHATGNIGNTQNKGDNASEHMQSVQSQENRAGAHMHSHGKIHGQGQQNRDVLDLDRSAQRTGVRRSEAFHEEASLRSQAHSGAVDGQSGPIASGGHAQMRQSTVREPGSSSDRDAEGQHYGHALQGESVSDSTTDSLSEGAPVHPGEHRDDIEGKALQGVHEHAETEAERQRPIREEPRCPRCNGDMWNNIGNKKNPKGPDYKCKNKDCGEAVWLTAKDGTPARPAPAAPKAAEPPSGPQTKEQLQAEFQRIIADMDPQTCPADFAGLKLEVERASAHLGLPGMVSMVGFVRFHWLNQRIILCGTEEAFRLTDADIRASGLAKGNVDKLLAALATEQEAFQNQEVQY